MIRVLAIFIVLVAGLHGCTVSTGVYVEKDWSTTNGHQHDMNTKFKIETSKEF